MIDVDELERREMYGTNSRITYAERIEIIAELRALREVKKAAEGHAVRLLYSRNGLRPSDRLSYSVFQLTEKFKADREALRLCLAELKLSVSDRPTLPAAIKAAEEALGQTKGY